MQSINQHHMPRTEGHLDCGGMHWRTSLSWRCSALRSCSTGLLLLVLQGAVPQRKVVLVSSIWALLTRARLNRQSGRLTYTARRGRCRLVPWAPEQPPADLSG